MKLEVCANSFESAVAAQEGGAHRIELCQELSLGGITPSWGLVTKVVQELNIPVFMLLRPRSGDFTYTDDEFDVMLRDLTFAREQGVQGIVSGVLNSDFTIDERRTKELINACGDLLFTFHRAFDWTPNPYDALETLIDLKTHRVLTSGQETTVSEGMNTLVELLQMANNQIGILPGGGVTVENIRDFKIAGFQEVHGSFSNPRKGNAHKLAMSQNTCINNGKIKTSNAGLIQKAINLIS